MPPKKPRIWNGPFDDFNPNKPPDNERQVIDYSGSNNNVNPNSGIPNQNAPIQPGSIESYLNPANDPSEQDISAGFNVAHSTSDLDAHAYSLHHTLGNAPNQAAPGRHTHQGPDSIPIPAATSLQELITGFTTFTPVWGTVGTNAVLGNGTFVARWLKLGTLNVVQYLLTFGSTTTYGTGNWRFYLPNAAATPAAISAIAVGTFSRPAGGASWVLQGILDAANNRIGAIIAAKDAGNVGLNGATDPGGTAYGAGGQVALTAIYEGA